MGNFALTLLAIHLLYKFALVVAVHKFQTNVWPRFQARYSRFLQRAIRHPYITLGSVIGIFIFSIFLFSKRTPNVVFFPKGDPNFIYVYLNLPIGTDVNYTDSVTKVLETKVYKVIGEHNPLVQSIITNVAVGATDPSDNDNGTYPNKSKIGVAFVDFSERQDRKRSCRERV